MVAVARFTRPLCPHCHGARAILELVAYGLAGEYMPVMCGRCGGTGWRDPCDRMTNVDPVRHHVPGPV